MTGDNRSRITPIPEYKTEIILFDELLNNLKELSNQIKELNATLKATHDELWDLAQRADRDSY